MNHLYLLSGWLFLSLALFFLLGLLKPLARFFYPGSPGVVARAAAPVIFACLSVACFRGVGLLALLAMVVAGIILIGINRRNSNKQKVAAYH